MYVPVRDALDIKWVPERTGKSISEVKCRIFFYYSSKLCRFKQLFKSFQPHAAYEVCKIYAVFKAFTIIYAL